MPVRIQALKGGWTWSSLHGNERARLRDWIVIEIRSRRPGIKEESMKKRRSSDLGAGEGDIYICLYYHYNR